MNDIPPADSSRFTYDGDATVETRIGADQQLIAAAVREALPGPELRALVLMGGYGRGEGGYTLIDGAPAPYNDYDYFAIVRGVGRRASAILKQRLAGVAHGLEQRVGVEVDFALLHEERLPRAEYSLMNAEMLWGHRVILGAPDILSAMPPMPFQGLSLGEFGRLMCNRGSLLLLNAQALHGDPPVAAVERERFVKYLFKAVLASGDALLAARGRYHPSYPAKRQRLKELDWPRLSELLPYYDLALEAKFHADYRPFLDHDLADWQHRVVALWLAALQDLEQTRLGTFPGWEVYARATVPKDQVGGGSLQRFKNLLLNGRNLGLRACLRHPAWALRYPRERLLSALPMLLQQPGQILSPALPAALGLPGDAHWAQAVTRYLRLWGRFS